jgi:hypothetical protein
MSSSCWQAFVGCPAVSGLRVGRLVASLICYAEWLCCVHAGAALLAALIAV